MAETYRPTAEERWETLEQGDFLKLSGDGVFATLQGEGATAGAPAVFMRLQNCNLKCGSDDNGWRCDAWYTWDRTTPEYWQESRNLDIANVADSIGASWKQNFSDEPEPRLVITGGEPLLQQAQLIPLLERLCGWKIEIETNGTIIPDDAFRDCQFNCSPKLASSGNLLQARYRSAALERIASFPNAWFKFVVAKDADVDEITKIVAAHAIDARRVILMSEGVVAAELAERDEAITRLALALGFAATARNHIFWFGDKRAT